MARKKKTTTDPIQGALALATTDTVIVITAPTSQDIAQALQAARAAVKEIQDEVAALAVTDLTTFNTADSLLGRIMDGEKLVEKKLRPVITPLREPLDQIYEMKREVEKPLAQAKADVKSKINTYQLEEKRRVDAEQEENRKKTLAMIQQAANEARAKQEEEAIMNPPQPSNEWILTGHQCDTFIPPVLEQAPVQQITFLAPPSTPMPTGAHSTTRFERRVRTLSLDDLVDACVSGIAPLDLLTIRPSKLEEYFLANPDMVSGWPGIEIYDHPVTVGR